MRQPLDDFLTASASFDPRALRRRFGLPHPLSNFATHGAVRDNAYADVILEFMNGVWERESPIHKAAAWFLFDSEQAFFTVCCKCGLDAEKLRRHLRLCQQLGPDGIRNLLVGAAESSNKSEQG